MKPAAFAYHRPPSVDAALACLAELSDAKVLAGGQSLMPMMNFRYVTPAHIIDLNRIPELAGIHEDDGDLVIGAMTRQRDVLDSPLVRDRCPLLAESLRFVGHRQTRNRGTIGGSLSHLDPSAEIPAVFAALDARLRVRRRGAERMVPIGEWTRGFMTPDLEADELLVSVRAPLWPAGHGFAFKEFARRHGDFAMAGAGVLVMIGASGKIERVAIALTGVDVGPLRLGAAEELLLGEAPDPERLDAAAAEASGVPGIADVHADETYRRKIAVVMTRRAMTAALERAGAGSIGGRGKTQ